jgi:hypothetical protein
MTPKVDLSGGVLTAVPASLRRRTWLLTWSAGTAENSGHDTEGVITDAWE